MIETCHHRIGYRRTCQDAVAVFVRGEGVVMVVADGAGGIEDGEIAAHSVVEGVRQVVDTSSSSIDWAQVLRQLDVSVPSGQSTACIVEISSAILRGASVGDSRIGVVVDDELVFPTDGQVRKPLLGSGQAQPRSFEMPWRGGLVVMGSDGFWNQMKADQVMANLRSVDFPVLAVRLCELVRLPSGNLTDDVAVACARRRIVHAPRRRIDLTIDS